MSAERAVPWRRSREPGKCDAVPGRGASRAVRWRVHAFAIAARAFAVLALFAGPASFVSAQDTPEMLAAMRAAMPPVPEVVPSWDELPAAQRAEVPALKIGMHRWHREAAERYVLIGGRRVGEGDVAGQQLWLREIREDGIVLQFRDAFFFYPF